MTLASVGTLASAVSRAASTTSLAMTTTAAAEAGNLVVVIIAKDNVGTSDNADNSETTAPTDSAGGNTWVKLGENTNDASGAGTGVCVAIWYSVLTNQINNGGTITCNWTTAVTAKCISAWEFTRDSSKTIFKATGNGIQRAVYDGADFGSLTSTPAEGSKEYLFIRSDGSENATADYAKTAAYTLIKNQTTGGTAGTGMTQGGEFEIKTATASDASNPTKTTTSNQHASIMGALYEAATLLVIQDTASASLADNLALTQHNVLAVTDTASASLADNLALTQHNVLAMQDTASASLADNLVLTANDTTVLVVQDAADASLIDNLALTQHNVLAVADAADASLADNLALTQHNVLAVQDTASATPVDNLALVQHNVLAIQDVTSASIIDNVNVVPTPEGGGIDFSDQGGGAYYSRS